MRMNTFVDEVPSGPHSLDSRSRTEGTICKRKFHFEESSERYSKKSASHAIIGCPNLRNGVVLNDLQFHCCIVERKTEGNVWAFDGSEWSNPNSGAQRHQIHFDCCCRGCKKLNEFHVSPRLNWYWVEIKNYQWNIKAPMGWLDLRSLLNFSLCLYRGYNYNFIIIILYDIVLYRMNVLAFECMYV